MQSELGLLLPQSTCKVPGLHAWTFIRQYRIQQNKNPQIDYISITLKYNNKEPLLKSSKYTMQLQYDYSEEGLMPWDGANMLRMLQFLELAHSQVRPHTPGGKARPWVPEKFLLLYTCSTKSPWVSCPFWREHPLYRVWLSAAKLVPLEKVFFGTT